MSGNSYPGGAVRQDDRVVAHGKIEGFIVQEVGWMDDEAHRPQVQWIKQYLDWLF